MIVADKLKRLGEVVIAIGILVPSCLTAFGMVKAFNAAQSNGVVDDGSLEYWVKWSLSAGGFVLPLVVIGLCLVVVGYWVSSRAKSRIDQNVIPNEVEESSPCRKV